MFYIGQKVVKIIDKSPIYNDGLDKYTKIGDEYEVTECFMYGKNHPQYWIKLIGVPVYVPAICFAPLLTDSIEYAEKLLEEITIEINEEQLVTK